jgi:hypothetical protein
MPLSLYSHLHLILKAVHEKSFYDRKTLRKFSFECFGFAVFTIILKIHIHLLPLLRCATDLLVSVFSYLVVC